MDPSPTPCCSVFHTLPSCSCWNLASQQLSSFPFSSCHQSSSVDVMSSFSGAALIYLAKGKIWKQPEYLKKHGTIQNDQDYSQINLTFSRIFQNFVNKFWKFQKILGISWFFSNFLKMPKKEPNWWKEQFPQKKGATGRKKIQRQIYGSSHNLATLTPSFCQNSHKKPNCGAGNLTRVCDTWHV